MEEENENKISEEKPIEENSDINETVEEVSNLEENKEKKPKKDYIKIKKSTLRNSTIFIVILAIIIVVAFSYPKFVGPTGGTILGNESSDIIEDSDVGEVSESEVVKLTVLNDRRCKECDTVSMLSRLRGTISNLEVKEVDYSTEEGKKLYEGLDVILPAFLFNEAVKQSVGYSEIENYLDQKGDYLSLRVGATHDPTKEICDNKEDDTGNGKVDCEDDDCNSNLICNKDAFAECASSHDLTPETVIFYYSNSCGWCSKMKPGVTQLQEEGYEFKWVESGNAEEEEVINACFRDYMGGGVPQFICPKTAEIKSGAFVDASKNLDVDLMRTFADDCIAG